MKSKFIFFYFLVLLFTNKSFAAKLVFNQIINNAGSIVVPANPIYPVNTLWPPVTTTIFTVPAGKVWKVNLGISSPQSWYFLSGNTQIVKLNGNIQGVSWLNGGDVVTLEATNLTGNGQGLSYTLNYAYTVIEFNVVP